MNSNNGKFHSISEEAMGKMVEVLDSREIQILLWRLGIGCPKPKTLAKIAKEYGITRERVRQIQSEALIKLDIPEVTHAILLRNSFRKYVFRNGTGVASYRISKVDIDRQKTLEDSSMYRSKAKHKSAYKSWSTEEDNQLISEFNNQMPINEMARIHDRSSGAIRSRLAKLDLIKD